MVNKKDGYFDEKRAWSLTKDSILSCYLTPYFTKVLGASRDGLVYVDGFAGPGKFEDGTDGSPVIAINKLREACRLKRGYKPYVQMIFGELLAGQRTALEANVRIAAGSSGYLKNDRIMVVSSFREAMQQAASVCLKKDSIPSSFFYYVDPYGIKDLDLSVLGSSPNLAHTEVLLNFCSVGFLRDACAALRVSRKAPENAIDYSEAMPVEMVESARTARLDAAIGSGGWRDIIQEYDNGLPYWEAERRISSLFCSNARRYFQFVTNMPIKDMRSGDANRGLLKYRLIHMTNNADGCVLMNDNMVKRNDELQITQQPLFLVDIDGQSVDPSVVKESMQKAIESFAVGKKVSMWQLAAPVISECGVFMKSTNLLKTYLGPFLDSGEIERVEKLTKTGRKASAFSNGSKIKVFRTS